MQAPSIGEVDLSQYTGKAGNLIAITVTDDHAVQSVHVKIENSDAKQQADPNQWLYTATAKNTSLAGDKITVSATDNPGHSVSKTRTL